MRHIWKRGALSVVAVLFAVLSNSTLLTMGAYAATEDSLDVPTTIQTSSVETSAPLVAEPALAAQSPQYPAPIACVDATKTANLLWQWAGSDHISVSLKGNKPACVATTLFFSSYTMPDTWDGNGFNGTAVPQTRYDSDSVTITPLSVS